MNRPDLRLWALWLALLLLVPLALDVVGVRPNAVPGTGAERPPLAPDRLLDEAYYAEIDTWLRDGGAARGLGLWARYQIDYKLFGDATGAAIVVGDNGWLFSRGWIDVPCVHIRAIEPPTHPGFIWTVPIAKVHWLADLLEPHDRPASCTVEARNELRQRMADDPQAIDLNDAIDADPAGRFYARDPHWNGMGRVEVARLLVERYAPGLWDPDAVRVDEERGLQGMDRFMGINYETVLADRRVDRGVEVEHVKPQAYGLGQLIWQHTRVADAPVIEGATYIFGDSQMASVIPYIEQYFEELIFVGWLRPYFAPLPYDALPPPDRVLAESTDQSAAVNFGIPALAEVIARLPEE
jgi:hypothetical protein